MSISHITITLKAQLTKIESKGNRDYITFADDMDVQDKQALELLKNERVSIIIRKGPEK